jgi:hypothetical protein
LRECLHPPIDSGLWKGVRRRFQGRKDILALTHCVTTIGAIDTYEKYTVIIKGLRIVAQELKCRLIEVEQLWEGTRINEV